MYDLHNVESCLQVASVEVRGFLIQQVTAKKAITAQKDSPLPLQPIILVQLVTFASRVLECPLPVHLGHIRYT